MYHQSLIIIIVICHKDPTKNEYTVAVNVVIFIK